MMPPVSFSSVGAPKKRRLASSRGLLDARAGGLVGAMNALPLETVKTERKPLPPATTTFGAPTKKVVGSPAPRALPPLSNTVVPPAMSSSAAGVLPRTAVPEAGSALDRARSVVGSVKGATAGRYKKISKPSPPVAI